MAFHFSSATNDEDILKSIEYAARRLKIDRFKDLQIEAIKSALKGQDVFVNLPTGYGKSVIFHALPLCADFLRERSESETAASREPRASPLSSSGTLPGSEGLHVGTGSCQSDTDVVTSSSSILLVISPLVSLMRDQVKSLKNRGLQAIYLGDASSEDVTLEGGIPYVFMSPETVFRRGFKLLESSVLKENLCAIVVDESHCVVKWGLNSDRLKAFRSEYGRLAELRSMVPSKVPVIALTATSTIATREHILTSLSMTQPALVTQSPDRSNIKYSVVEVPESETADIFRDLCNELKREGKQTARTIIFCRSHRQCSDLYSGFKKEIEDVSLFGMFHLTTEDLRKEAVLKSFADPNGSIRVLFATMAFGMGVDCRGVRRVFHLGPPEDIEDYVQESGRVGRDGKESHAVLVLYKGWGRAKVSQKMKEYIKNEVVCRRKFLMEPFEGVDGIECPITPHSCCDICTQSCECRDDDAHTCPFQYCEKVVQMSQQMTVCRDVSDEEREELHNRLLTLRNEILSHVSVEGSILAGADITSGIPICEVQALVQNCEYIGSFEALCKNFNFFGHEEDIWIVLRDTLPSCGTSHEVILSKDVHSNDDIYMDEFDSDTDDEYARAVLLSDLDSDN